MQTDQMGQHQEVQKMGLSQEIPESTCLLGVQGENRMGDETENGWKPRTAERDSGILPPFPGPSPLSKR